MSIWLEIGALILSALAGAALVLWINVPNKSWLKLLISFSGAYLLGLCMVHLLPYSMTQAPKIAGYIVLAGFLLQQILELFSQGVEHGHLHTHRENDFGFPALVMISLFLHSFIEGMPFGGHDDHHHHSLLLGIVLHKLPVAMVLTAVLLRSGMKKQMVIIWLVLFALMAPFGTLFYKYYLTAYDPQNVVVLSAGINALLVGVLLHVSTTILFESTDGHKFNLLKFISILIGFILSAFLI